MMAWSDEQSLYLRRAAVMPAPLPLLLLLQLVLSVASDVPSTSLRIPRICARRRWGPTSVRDAQHCTRLVI